MSCSACQAEVPPRAPFCPNCGARIEDPFVGQTLANRYHVDAKIAVGGFGGIYRATQTASGRQVAIKIMHEELCADASLVARFRREGMVLVNLRDAHTVTTYEVDELPDGRLFIVMELLEGETLYDVFHAAGPLPWTRVFRIARAMCSALAEAHALGVVHRDLKPANIYLEARPGQQDFVKVLDFGIAKVMQGSGLDGAVDLTKMGQAVGTLEYMAPEQLMGGKCDGRTDIYTLGVVAYETITGRRPYADALGMELLTAQLSQPLVPASARVGVPPDVDRVLARCLAQDSADRFVDVGELAGALDAVLSAPVWNPPAGSDLARDTLRAPPDDPPPVPEAPDTVRQTLPAEVRDTVPQLDAPKPLPRAARSLHLLVIVASVLAAMLVGGVLAWLLSILGR